jgi:Uma2 family endonuclease
MATVLDPADGATVLDDGPVEVVNGVNQEPRPMSAYATTVANRLFRRLDDYGDRTGSGQAMMDMLFRLPLRRDRRRVRKPDVAFVTFDRWPADRPLPYFGNPMDVVPDVMVEVVSPTDQAEATMAKAVEYLEAGARLVWLAFPVIRTVYAYTSPTAVRGFGPADELDAGDVLPGFKTPVAGLFPPVVGLPDPDRDDPAAA